MGYNDLKLGTTVMLMFIRLTVSLLSDYCHENKNNILVQAITGCNMPNVKMHKVGRYIDEQKLVCDWV